MSRATSVTNFTEMKDITIFQPPWKKAEQQIDITTLPMSCVGLNVSIFNQLHTKCKLTHLHVRWIMEPRLKRRRFLSVDNFLKTKPAFVLPWREGLMPDRQVQVCGPPFNAVLACNADRTFQHIRPNETHLCPSLELWHRLRARSG